MGDGLLGEDQDVERVVVAVDDVAPLSLTVTSAAPPASSSARNTGLNSCDGPSSVNRLTCAPRASASLPAACDAALDTVTSAGRTTRSLRA